MKHVMKHVIYVAFVFSKGQGAVIKSVMKCVVM